MNPRILNPEELQALFRAANPRSPFGDRDLAMLILALHTGLRVSELVGLDVSHVAGARGVRHTLELPARLAKGERGRLLPLNRVAREAISDLLDFNQRRGFSVDPGAPLLVNRKHQRLSTRYVQRLMEDLRGRADLDVHATPHTLRHTFASQVARRHGNLRAVQALLGHRRLATVEIYTHVDREELAQAVASLE